MDLMGPLFDLPDVLVMADPFTKSVEAFAVPNMEAETVVQVVVREIIYWFGMPRALHSDQ